VEIIFSPDRVISSKNFTVEHRHVARARRLMFASCQYEVIESTIRFHVIDIRRCNCIYIYFFSLIDDNDNNNISYNLDNT